MNQDHRKPGKIFVVATPIGNLMDMSIRAINTLKQVDLILAEDTRHANILLQHYQITTACESFHAHNEQKKTERYLTMVQNGTQLALISDAGTPLINDPGFPLIEQARQLDIEITPIPGPCAFVTALSAAGIACDSFSFHGFPPVKSSAKRMFFETIKSHLQTHIFYESTHRIVDTLTTIAAVYGPTQQVLLAKELTKTFEQFQLAPVNEVINWLNDDPKRLKGEFVLMIPAQKATEVEDPKEEEAKKILAILIKHLSPKQAAQTCQEITGVAKNKLYQYALKLQKI
ncbi:MAG: 16S rRNA (cytidine(1402)-2'-O)-methyltransferase [Gammaproteobacteria bacterium]|nr:16S rRNA (cytidine(1402)-2'-O)-methyltransferase [Gammaproteobacteria bacterium]